MCTGLTLELHKTEMKIKLCKDANITWQKGQFVNDGEYIPVNISKQNANKMNASVFGINKVFRKLLK